MMETELDVLIVGAGPVGLACAIECSRRELRTRVVDKGSLVNSLVGYPTGMEFFSTPDLLEIGGHPFSTQRYKPLREEALDYYRRVAESEALDLALYEKVHRLDGSAGAFEVVTDRGVHRTRFVIIATGFFDVANPLGVPGEDLPKVTHYFKEAYPYAGQNVVVVGAKNSAAKAALSCYRHGARVTMLVRGPSLSDSIKYWIRPDLENRIEEGSIEAFFGVTLTSISSDSVTFKSADGERTIPNDWVLAMTGYRPDYGFLEAMGVKVSTDPARTPIHDGESFETNRKGVFLAGTVCGGLATSKWFIENGRFHAKVIAAAIAHRKR